MWDGMGGFSWQGERAIATGFDLFGSQLLEGIVGFSGCIIGSRVGNEPFLVRRFDVLAKLLLKDLRVNVADLLVKVPVTLDHLRCSCEIRRIQCL